MLKTLFRVYLKHALILMHAQTMIQCQCYLPYRAKFNFLGYGFLRIITLGVQNSTRSFNLYFLFLKLTNYTVSIHACTHNKRTTSFFSFHSIQLKRRRSVCFRFRNLSYLQIWMRTGVVLELETRGNSKSTFIFIGDLRLGF